MRQKVEVALDRTALVSKGALEVLLGGLRQCIRVVELAVDVALPPDLVDPVVAGAAATHRR